MKTILISVLVLFFTDATLSPTVFAKGPHRVLILGDSLTEGYGVESGAAFPSIMQQDYEARGQRDVEIINGGISASTTASGVTRLKWELQKKPDILILALGANDALRGLKPEETKANLIKIVKMAQDNKIQVLIAGMKAPPNYGKNYEKAFEKIFPEVAHEYQTHLMPFLLEDVAGEVSLNQADGIHPNEKGHRKVAQSVEKYLEGLL